MNHYYLAIDIGASSGRHMLSWIEDGKLRLEEVYRFPNGMQEQDGALCWDYDAIFNHVLAGMRRCKEIDKIPARVGIDTWGCDFVLLDDQDQILGKTIGYRDHRTDGMDYEVSKKISEEDLYSRTGIQKALYNTVYQLMAVKKKHPEYLAQAKTFLMTSDYLHWKLCGVKANEYTQSSTSQLLNPYSCQWDISLIEQLGYPSDIFQEIVYPGTSLGRLTKPVREAIGYDCEVILPATHDTASAIMAITNDDPDTVFISSGTWSLMGVRLAHPDCSVLSRELNFTNEGGYRGICYLKNIMGLWMIQSVKKELCEQGIDLSFEALCKETANETISGIIPCDDARFLSPKHMITEIQHMCDEMGYEIPETPAQLAAVVYNSLAVRYAEVIHDLEIKFNKKFHFINIIGGGSNADYLNQLTAKYTGCTVYAGPGEATAIGNAIVQMLHSGEFSSLTEAKESIKNSFGVKEIFG